MAKNGARGSARTPVVAIPGRARNPKTGLWTNRNAVAGKFMDVKKSGGTLKRIPREN